MPWGCFTNRSFSAREASPCHLHTGNPDSCNSWSSRLNWSLISAFSGLMYNTPTDREGRWYSSVSTGRNAASVFPEAVPEESSRLSSVSQTTWQASF